MNRSEAIQKIEAIIDNGQDYGYWTDAQRKALNLAIEALREEEMDDYCNNCPYVSWDNDLISRQAVTDLLLDAQDGSGQTYEVIRGLLHDIAFMPSVSDAENATTTDCISRQQAIEALTGWETEPLDEDIVRTLNNLPPATPIFNEDCISRTEILKHAYMRDGVMSVSVDSIKLAPSVTLTERTGECRTCKRSSDYLCKNGENGTRCPIEEHYALPRDGYCHLYEPYKDGDTE